MAGTAVTPRGWYLAGEVGQLVGVSGERVGQWARRGYIRSSRSASPPRVYSFQDVAEAMAVRELLERGVPQREIRRAIENLRDEYGDWPLTAAPLSVTREARSGGRKRIVHRHGEVAYDIGKGHGRQGMLTYGELQELAGLLRRGGWVIRELPDIRHIEVDPDRLSGRPTIRHRRLAATKVAELAKSGVPGLRVLRADYDLERPEIVDAVRWYDAVKQYAPAA